MFFHFHILCPSPQISLLFPLTAEPPFAGRFKSYHVLLRCRAAPAILQTIRNTLADRRSFLIFWRGAVIQWMTLRSRSTDRVGRRDPKFDCARLCKHLVKIDLLTLVLSHDFKLILVSPAYQDQSLFPGQGCGLCRSNRFCNKNRYTCSNHLLYHINRNPAGDIEHTV